MERRRLFAVWATVLAVVAPVWAVTRTVRAAPPAGSTLTGLVGYWSFDSQTLFNEPDTGGSVLTKGNGASWTANGKFGGALSLNGGSQSLYDTSSPAWLPVGNSTYTQSVWFKPTVVSGSGGLVGWGNYGAGRRTIALRMIENSGGFRHYWWGADLDCSGAQCPLSAGNWYHVASTWDGTTRKLYLNGVLKRSDTPGANNATAANFHIGKTCCSEYFNGLIDDVAIFSRALTQAEVTELADGTTPTTTTTSTTTTTTTTTTSTTTTTTTTVPVTTTTVRPVTTTAAPVLEIVVSVPATTTTTTSPPAAAAGTVPSADPVVVSAATTTVPVRSAVASPTTAVPAGVRTPGTSTTSTTTTVPANAGGTVAPPVPKVQVVQSGEAGVRIGDSVEKAVVERVDNQLVVSAGEMKATLGGLGTDGAPVPLDDDGNVRLKPGDNVRIRLAGFRPGSTVEAWLFSTPVLMGTAKVDADGSVVGNFSIPRNAPEGAHRIAIVARTKDGKPATLTVGVMVGEWEKSSGVTVWLIVLPIVLAAAGALVLPATRRRRQSSTDR